MLDKGVHVYNCDTQGKLAIICKLIEQQIREKNLDATNWNTSPYQILIINKL